MSHIPASAMHHAKPATTATDRRETKAVWKSRWLIGAAVVAVTFSAVRALRAAS